MNRSTSREMGRTRRHGIVVVQVVVLITVLMGFAALTIDIGTLYRARGELQAAADAAALAGASAFTTDAMLKVRLTPDDDASLYEVLSATVDRVNEFSQLNYTLGSPTVVELSASDISSGWIDLTSGTSAIDPARASNTFNAVQVTVRRASGGGDGSNGPVPFFLAPILGLASGDTFATAAGAFDDRFAGIAVGSGSAGTLPLSTDDTLYTAGLASAPDSSLDNYGYDDGSGSVVSMADGVNEINIFPGVTAPGNFGLLNIGTPNNGLPGLSYQIENGVSAAEMQAEIGTSEITFYDSGGSPTAYSITGTPGMENGLIPSFELQIGQTVSFFVHGAVAGNGANSTYTITGIRFARVMGVQLTGPQSQRGIWVQPVVYSGADVITGVAAPSSNGMIGRIVLVR